MNNKYQEWKPDEIKFKELVLYVAARCDKDPHFGAVKLNKILFYSDFLHFAEYGSPITGVEYRKYAQGPCPARMKVIKNEMEREELAYEYINPLHTGLSQKRLLARRKPDLSKFTSEEIATVDTVIDRLRSFNGTEVSEFSHAHPCWQLAVHGETIPYFTALIADGPPDLTDEESEWVEQASQRLVAASVTPSI